MTVWVLTWEHDEDNQYGEYFQHAWDHKPTSEELTAQDIPTSTYHAEDYHAHILNGGGRIKWKLPTPEGKPQRWICEHKWYHLKEVT